MSCSLTHGILFTTTITMFPDISLIRRPRLSVLRFNLFETKTTLTMAGVPVLQAALVLPRTASGVREATALTPSPGHIMALNSVFLLLSLILKQPAHSRGLAKLQNKPTLHPCLRPLFAAQGKDTPSVSSPTPQVSPRQRPPRLPAGPQDFPGCPRETEAALFQHWGASRVTRTTGRWLAASTEPPRGSRPWAWQG